MCGAAKDFTIMLVGRSFQGSGAGGIMTLTEAIITDLIPLRERGNYFALISIVWAIGTVAGNTICFPLIVLANLTLFKDHLLAAPLRKVTHGAGSFTSIFPLWRLASSVSLSS
jgi:MFS family permease